MHKHGGLMTFLVFNESVSIDWFAIGPEKELEIYGSHLCLIAISWLSPDLQLGY